LHPEIKNVLDRIINRSEDTRKEYLKSIDDMENSNEINRNTISCSNMAHVAASTPKSDQLNILMNKKPNLGIVSSYNDMLSAHKPYENYPSLIKSISNQYGATAQMAGGVPAMCDGITQGRVGMELSLMSRDVIAMSTAIALSHGVYDAAICLGICDKIIPGLFIGALSFGYLPVVFMPSGPMASGLPNEEKANIRKAFAKGEVTREELIKAESKAYHGEGTCTFYGTANTNQLIMEVMGLQLPSASFVPPSSIERQLIIDKTVECVLHMSEQNIKMGEMLDSKSWVNAMVALIASGGSTNLAIHLIAMAEAGGYKITIEDIDEIASITPIITNIYPNGSADVNDFHNAGGVSAFIGSLLDGGFLFNDVKTLFGNGLEVFRGVHAMKYKKYNLQDVYDASAQEKFKVISTFAGGGGSSTGYRLAGGKVLVINEFVEEAQKTYAENYPDTVILPGDIKELTGKDFLDAAGVGVGEIDILDGSPPCSAFSVAGKLSHNIHEEEHVDLWGNVTIEKVPGKHSDGWGKTKNYSDGKMVENIEDLFFEFLRVAKVINPLTFSATITLGLISFATRRNSKNKSSMFSTILPSE
jgi:6-phosphogluconate dehydratase